MIEREAQGAFLSQWSLTFEVRKSPALGSSDPRGNRVAMEPDL